MKRIILYLFSFSTLTAYAQFDGLKNFVDKVGNTASKVNSSLSNPTDFLRNKLANSKKEYDESNFNYAISLSDNAGLFEFKARFERESDMLMAVMNRADGSIVLNNKEQADEFVDAGEMLFANGKYKLAEKSFVSAQKLLVIENDTNSSTYANLLGNLGLIYHTTGRYGMSEEYTQKAMKIREKIEDDKGSVAASINNLAVLMKDIGKFRVAEELIEQALEKNKVIKGVKSVPYALALNNKAMLYQTLGRFAEAETILNQSLETLSQLLGEKSDNYLRLLTNKALLQQAMNRDKEAETTFKSIISIRERRLGTGHPDYAHVINLLANLYMKMQKYADVEKYYKKANDIFLNKMGDKSPAYAETQFNLGNLYRLTNRNTEALDRVSKALSIRKEVFPESHPALIKTIFQMGLIHWQNKNYVEADQYFNEAFSKTLKNVDAFFISMSEQEKSDYWEDINYIFEIYPSFVLEAQKEIKGISGKLLNNQIITKALLLNSSNKTKNALLNSSDKVLRKNYQEWLNQKSYLAKLYSYSQQELKEEKINLDSMETVVKNLEKKLLQSAAGKFKTNYIDAITWQDIQKKLLSNEGILEIVRVQKFNKNFIDSASYLGLLITKDSPNPIIIEIRNGNELDGKFLKFYKNSIKNKLDDDVSYTNYWKPFQAQVSNLKKLYVSLDGVYNQLSINTLKNANGKYVFDEISLSFITNPKDVLNTNKAISSTNTACVIGNPTYGGSGKVLDLPGTKVETDEINTLLKSKLYATQYMAQKAAKEDKIKMVKSPKIIHIATHGFFQVDRNKDKQSMVDATLQKGNQNPMLRSGLLLADAETFMDNKPASNQEDGILTAYEVMQMDLSKTDLVVLSACETGLGEVKAGEGVFGLQRAFIVAGANSLIMSLWKVSDEATKLLMISFYKNLLNNQSKQLAFRNAQTTLKSQMSSPYYWGAFVMIE